MDLTQSAHIYIKTEVLPQLEYRRKVMIKPKHLKRLGKQIKKEAKLPMKQIIASLMEHICVAALMCGQDVDTSEKGVLIGK